LTTDRCQPIQHLDIIEIGVNSGLAGAQDCVSELNDISQKVTKYTLRVVKKEKRRRRSSAILIGFD
jgi:hypothetical protein